MSIRICSVLSFQPLLRSLLRRRRLLLLIAALLGFAMVGGSFVATALIADDAPGAKKGDEEEVPPPEDVTLSTDDGWDLTMTYYPAISKGKNAPPATPVVLLHEDKGSRKDFTGDDGLAKYLQDKGYAVLVPDLRGHGGAAPAGAKPVANAKPKKLPPAQYKKMVTQDMLALKNFLWKKNNEGKLNIDKLILVGSELGAAVAVDATLYDSFGWDQERPSYGPLKLGGFVRALILISPPSSQPGMVFPKSVQRIPSNVPVMLVVGALDRASSANATQINSILERTHPQPANAKAEERTLLFYEAKTKLQGVTLIKELSDPEKGYPFKINQFIEWRVENNDLVKKDNKWDKRKLPHE
jgi:pimeloyl-ACP methyl ester carboxylesterase